MEKRSDDEALAQGWRDSRGQPPAPAPAPMPAATGDAATDYAAAWGRHDSYLDDASRRWNEVKQDYPKTALLVGSLPVTGEITSALELNDAIHRGDKADMALAAAGLIPGGKLVKAGAKAMHAGEAVQKLARTTLTGADAYSAAKASGQALKNTGAAKLAAGAGAEAASAGSNLADYAHSWNQHAN
jgi:hypothetical protein